MIARDNTGSLGSLNLHNQKNRVLKANQARWWWHTSLMPALWRQRQRQRHLCEFEVSLVYRVSFRNSQTTQRNPVSKTKQNAN